VAILLSSRSATASRHKAATSTSRRARRNTVVDLGRKAARNTGGRGFHHHGSTDGRVAPRDESTEIPPPPGSVTCRPENDACLWPCVPGGLRRRERGGGREDLPRIQSNRPSHQRALGYKSSLSQVPQRDDADLRPAGVRIRPGGTTGRGREQAAAN